MVASLSMTTFGYLFSDMSSSDTTLEEDPGLTTTEENRIYGGTEANIDKYPFLASLRYPLFDRTYCGGALIAPQYILTAGHCVITDEITITVTFGTNDSTGSGSGEASSYKVINGFRHPLYKKEGHTYDVGLLKLEKPIKRQTAKLCARDGSDNKIGTKATVLGWGRTENSGGLVSPVLNKLTIPIISNSDCAKFPKYVGRVTPGMLCAGVGDGRDTCNGDSGSPLIVDNDILIGCVSWGSKCGQQAGIFTRLTYVMDYIEDILDGGDGSKFGNGTSSEVLPPSSDLSKGSSFGNIDTNIAWLLEMINAVSVSDSTEMDIISDTKDTDAVNGKVTKTEEESSGSATEETAAPVQKLGTKTSTARRHRLDWLFASESDSRSDDTVVIKDDKTTELLTPNHMKTLKSSEDSAYQSESATHH
ncbi:Serine protease [Phytophthora megakarya]|uniref:Serine protease n=1 Tax=Phytophthora megakarya TaxID=4795 RepID=A0A225VHJ6_9STRA|nr:Serine protease [Phytophthora megakarya]